MHCLTSDHTGCTCSRTPRRPYDDDGVFDRSGPRPSREFEACAEQSVIPSQCTDCPRTDASGRVASPRQRVRGDIFVRSRHPWCAAKCRCRCSCCPVCHECCANFSCAGHDATPSNCSAQDRQSSSRKARPVAGWSARPAAQQPPSSRARHSHWPDCSALRRLPSTVTWPMLQGMPPPRIDTGHQRSVRSCCPLDMVLASA